MSPARATAPLPHRPQACVDADAVELAVLLPEVMRTLFSLDADERLGRLPLAQVRLMAVLASGPRSITSAGDDLGISASAVTQLADRMQRAGLVERVTDRTDRRMRLLRLTPDGVAADAARAAARERAARSALAAMPHEGRRRVLGALRALLEAASAGRGAGRASGQDD